MIPQMLQRTAVTGITVVMGTLVATTGCLALNWIFSDWPPQAIIIFAAPVLAGCYTGIFIYQSAIRPTARLGQVERATSWHDRNSAYAIATYAVMILMLLFYTCMTALTTVVEKAFLSRDPPG